MEKNEQEQPKFLRDEKILLQSIEKVIGVIQKANLPTDFREEKSLNQLAADILSAMMYDDMNIQESDWAIKFMAGYFQTLLATMERTIAENFDKKIAKLFEIENKRGIPLDKILK